jgi:hypothetical protein
MKRNNFTTTSLLILFLASYAGIIYSNAQPFFKEPLAEYQKENWCNHGQRNNGISFLKDAEGNDFVLKQQASKETAIHDTLGAYIGSSIDIPINQVELLPVGSYFMGKTLTNTATLHTNAPGKEVYNTEKSDLCIREGIASLKNLQSISQHKDLCLITALNIYLNNDDSYNRNLFFDGKTNRFCAIDQGYVFNTAHEIPNNDAQRYDPYNEKNTLLHHIFPTNSLVSKTQKFIKTLHEMEISQAELDALINVKTKLDQLIDQYPAEKIYNKWMQIADKAQYVYTPQKKESIKVIIEYNVYESKKLRSELDKVIKAQQNFRTANA